MGTYLITQGGSHGSMSGNNSAANFGGECLPRQVSDPCAYVRANPACAAEGLDYLRFIECPTDANDGAAKVVLLIGWCAVLFLAIGTVGDAFFAPAVERIALRLRLPDDVAGATLLALGGAAPDIFTQIAALVESDEPDLKLALSESIGAGLFVATFGKALAVLVGLAWEAKRHERDGSHDPNTEHAAHSQQGVSVEPFPYVRDVVAYAFMLVLAFVAMSSKTVSWQLSSALVLSYVLYVCVVCLGWGRTRLEPALVRLAGGGGGVSGERPGESDVARCERWTPRLADLPPRWSSAARVRPPARVEPTPASDDDDEATLLPSSRGDGGGVGSSSSGADGIPDGSSTGSALRRLRIPRRDRGLGEGGERARGRGRRRRVPRARRRAGAARHVRDDGAAHPERRVPTHSSVSPLTDLFRRPGVRYGRRYGNVGFLRKQSTRACWRVG